jgi:hypothetical protein
MTESAQKAKIDHWFDNGSSREQITYDSEYRPIEVTASDLSIFYVHCLTTGVNIVL